MFKGSAAKGGLSLRSLRLYLTNVYAPNPRYDANMRFLLCCLALTTFVTAAEKPL